MLNFIKKTCQIISESGCTILHSHHQCMRVPTAPHTQTFSILGLFNFSHSGGCIMVPCGFHLLSSDE